MPMLQSSIHVFSRVARRCTDIHFSNLFSDGSMIYVTDTAVALRSSAFTLPDVIQDSPWVDTLIRAFDKYASAADLRLAALGPKAKCPGEYPTISENLRAYGRYSKNQGEKAAFYPVGDCMVNASLLADVLTAIPDACVYAVPGDPLKPLFFRGEYAEGILLPMRLSMQRIGRYLQILADYQRESGEQGADPSRPFITIPLEKIKEQAEAEDKRQQEARRQQEQEREARMRQSQAEEAAQREQDEKEKDEKRENARKILLSDGENMPVDGAALCELAAEMGVSIPLRTKGFILQKLATISIANGQFKRYTFRAKKKGAQGSDACFKYIQALIDALKMQPIEEESENLPENNVPELENRPENLENPVAKESNSRIHNINMEKFGEQFQKEYNFLYDCRGYVAGYDEAVSAFDRFQADHADFVREFAQYRGDVVSSDREAAAFMFALDSLDDPAPDPDGTPSHSEQSAENNGAESGVRAANPAPISAAVCPAMYGLLALSAGTLSTLARQKNLPDSEKYSALEVFHEKIVRAALTLDVSQYANWQQLFEAAYSVAFPAPAPEQKVPQTEKQLQTVGSVCHMVYCTGPNPLGEQKTMDFPSLAECREWIAAHRSADLARSCGYTVYAGSHDYVLRDGDGFPVVLLTYSRAAPVPPQNGAKSDDRPANLSRKRKKPNPEKRHEAAQKANADKALLQTFVESDLSCFGHVTADTQSALQFQGYFWDGSKLRKCKKPLHVFSVSTG